MENKDDEQAAALPDHAAEVRPEVIRKLPEGDKLGRAA
jgi:hypothetical protein